MNTERDRIKEARRRIRKEYAEVYDSISSLLFEIDPMGINFSSNTDEYEPEVDTILPRIKNLKRKEVIERVVKEEFAKWFGDESIDEIGVDTFEKITDGIVEIMKGKKG